MPKCYIVMIRAQSRRTQERTMWAKTSLIISIDCRPLPFKLGFKPFQKFSHFMNESSLKAAIESIDWSNN